MSSRSKFAVFARVIAFGAAGLILSCRRAPIPPASMAATSRSAAGSQATAESLPATKPTAPDPAELARKRIAMGDLRTWRATLDQYVVDNNRFPEAPDAAGAAALLTGSAGYADKLPVVDPWGQPYQYRVLGARARISVAPAPGSPVDPELSLYTTESIVPETNPATTAPPSAEVKLTPDGLVIPHIDGAPEGMYDGGTATLHGWGFSPNAFENVVDLEGEVIRADSVVIEDPSICKGRITFKVPPGAVSGELRVTVESPCPYRPEPSTQPAQPLYLPAR